MPGPKIDAKPLLDGRYELRREIARSERSVIHLAKQVFTLRPVAIKLLAQSRLREEGARDALLAEARLLTELRHPCLVEVLDAGELRTSTFGARSPYLVMEMIEGRALDGILAARTRLNTDDALGLVLSLCDVLGYMHDSGVVHRAVTASNVLIPAARVDPRLERIRALLEPVKLINLGAAVAVITQGHDPRLPNPPGGVVEYLAPELLGGEELDGRSDIYSLAVLLVECLTGDLPRAGEGSAQQEALSTGGGLSVPLARVVARALSPEPGDRFEHMDAFATALREAQHKVPTPPPPPPPATSRRQHARAAYLTPVRVARATGQRVDASSEDLSEGGMLLVAPRVLDDGEEVEVRFSLPISGQLAIVRAVARWSRAARDGRGAIGLAFVELDDAIRAEIAQYLRYFGQPTLSERPSAD